jgi:hypothetical protein
MNLCVSKIIKYKIRGLYKASILALLALQNALAAS